MNKTLGLNKKNNNSSNNSDDNNNNNKINNSKKSKNKTAVFSMSQVTKLKMKMKKLRKKAGLTAPPKLKKTVVPAPPGIRRNRGSSRGSVPPPAPNAKVIKGKLPPVPPAEAKKQ